MFLYYMKVRDMKRFDAIPVVWLGQYDTDSIWPYMLSDSHISR
jgi:hypothetical protein